MYKNLFKVNVMMFVLCLGLFTSCGDDDANVVPENFGSEEAFVMQKTLNAGKRGCLEVVFPIEITLPDDAIIEVESFVDAKTQIQAWKEGNPDVDGRPSVVYPIEVITFDGETVSIEAREEIKSLLKDCKDKFDDRPRGHKACFRLEYPIEISFPDETVVEVNTPRELKIALRKWRRENRDVAERPELVYPLVIKFEDDTTQTINSKDELKAAKEACKED